MRDHAISGQLNKHVYKQVLAIPKWRPGFIRIISSSANKHYGKVKIKETMCVSVCVCGGGGGL